jgi:Concanavalin A-like lectin/glucanases superfamily
MFSQLIRLMAKEVAASGPGSISDLLLWFNPSGISGSNGSEMTTWTDDGPYALVPADIGSSGNRPTVATNTLNGYTTAANANKSGLQIPSSPTGVSLTDKDTWTAFFIVKTSGSDADFAALPHSTLNGMRFGFSSGRNLQLTYSSVAAITGEPAFAYGSWYSVIFVVNSSVMAVYINGSPAYSFGTHSMSAPTFPAVFDLCSSAYANALNGNLAEMALYDKALNSTEISTLTDYASSTYGLALPTSAPMTRSILPYLWLNPDGISGADGSDIASWTDSGLWGIGNAAQGGSGNRLTVEASSLNGYTVAKGSKKLGLQNNAAGSNDPSPIYLASTNSWTLYAIVYWSTITGITENDFCAIGNGSSNGFRFGLNSSGYFTITIPNVGNFNGSNAVAPSLNTWHTVVVQNNAGALTVYVDGSSYSFGTHTTTYAPTTFRIGEGYTGSSAYAFQGKLAEIAIYNGVLGSSDISALHSYATSKYGI